MSLEHLYLRLAYHLSHPSKPIECRTCFPLDPNCLLVLVAESLLLAVVDVTRHLLLLLALQFDHLVLVHHHLGTHFFNQFQNRVHSQHYFFGRQLQLEALQTLLR